MSIFFRISFIYLFFWEIFSFSWQEMQEARTVLCYVSLIVWKKITDAALDCFLFLIKRTLFKPAVWVQLNCRVSMSMIISKHAIFMLRKALQVLISKFNFPDQWAARKLHRRILKVLERFKVPLSWTNEMQHRKSELNHSISVRFIFSSRHEIKKKHLATMFRKKVKV